MPCAICKHTLANLGLDQSGRRVFWCPRCGSLKTERDTLVSEPDGSNGTPGVFIEHDAPKLAHRVSKLLELLKKAEPLRISGEAQKALRDVGESIGVEL